MNKPQLFCLTYAGGNASFYDIIEEDLSDIEVIKLEYAGHGSRHREECYKNFDELVEDLYPKVKELLKGDNYSFMGYSMGTIALVEILKKIISDKAIKEPVHVFLAAHEPHSKVELTGYTEDKLDEWVINSIIKFGAIPDKLMGNKSFWRIYLPLYRADFSIIGKYRFEELGIKSQIPATFFYSETDTPRREMDLWKNYFIGECEFHQYEGNHFFIQEHHSEMSKIIRQKLTI